MNDDLIADVEEALASVDVTDEDSFREALALLRPELSDPEELVYEMFDDEDTADR